MNEERRAGSADELERSEQIDALAQQLAETEAALQALTAGQVDAVVDPISGVPILLRQAQAELRRAHEELAARTAELEASEARFRAVFEQSAVGIAILDRQGRMMGSNPALQEMLGRTNEVLCGSAFADFAHPDEEVEAEAAIYRRMAAGELDRHRTELRYVRRDGRIGWANVVLSLVRDAESAPRFIVAIVEDITERKKAQQALIQSEKLATTGRLAVSLAHEINNPLQTVIGCLGLAKETLEGSDGASELETYVAIARDELKRAARIVTRLRDVSQPADTERGEPADVNELVDQVLRVSRENLRDRQIEIVRHLAPELPRPILIPDRIKQVFLNLILNASDAMVDGGQLLVRTGYDERNDEVIVEFVDQGAGIPEGMMDRLFDPFFSTKTEGSGLGLFVSQNIVQEQGGRIEVESTLGEGATFTVVLTAPPP